MQIANHGGVLNGEKCFYTAVYITRHKIGAAQINFFFAPIKEIIHAAVFEETAYNAGDANVFANPF